MCRKCVNPDVCFQCPSRKQRFLLNFTQDFRSQFRKWQYTPSCYNWNNWTAWKFWFISFSKQSCMTGQHDRQDERLTGQLPNQFGHCPLTGRYFEPWPLPFIQPQKLASPRLKCVPSQSIQPLTSATPTSGCNFTIYIMTNIGITNTRLCLCHLQNDWHWWQKHQHQVVRTFTIYIVQGSKLTFSFRS